MTLTNSELSYFAMFRKQGIRFNNVSELRNRIHQHGLINNEAIPKQLRRGYNSGLSKQYKSYLTSANRRGFIFELTPDQFDILIAADCVYCGNTGFGIDRQDNKQGYTTDNSVSCCSICNRMKMALSVHEFMLHVKRIARHNS